MNALAARKPWNAVSIVLMSGLVGWISIDVYLAITVPYTVPGATAVMLFQWDASNLVGSRAYDGGAAMVLIGLAADLGVSLCWSAAYTAAALQFGMLARRPLISGACMGIMVMVIMRYIVVPLGAAHQPHPTLINDFNNVIAHVIFFGIPVALIVARYMQKPGANAGARRTGTRKHAD